MKLMLLFSILSGLLGNQDLFESKKITLSSGKKYTTWEELFPDKEQRKIAIALNRRNTLIRNNQVILIPKQGNNYMDYTPFPLLSEDKEPHILVDLNKLAWAAYGSGILLNWGPANGGMKKCRETGLMKCITHPGNFIVIRMGGVVTKSKLYPIECTNKKKCGFPMYYYIQFHSDGTGLHGAKSLPGYNASHGCIRLLREDARWLNKNFAQLGTRIIIKKY